jgi:acyl carrier protein
MMTVTERVYRVISQVMGVALSEVDGNSSPDSVETWDSLRHMNLVMALEEEFGIQFSEQQIVEMLNAELIILEVQSLLGQPA